MLRMLKLVLNLFFTPTTIVQEKFINGFVYSHSPDESKSLYDLEELSLFDLRDEINDRYDTKGVKFSRKFTLDGVTSVFIIILLSDKFSFVVQFSHEQLITLWLAVVHGCGSWNSYLHINILFCIVANLANGKCLSCMHINCVFFVSLKNKQISNKQTTLFTNLT